MEQEMLDLYNKLTEDEINSELQMLELIDYTPDLYDYIVARATTVLPILYCNKNSVPPCDNNVVTVRDKLETLGITSSTDLQERYMIFFRTDPVTKNISIAYFFNGPLRDTDHSMHIVSLYSDKSPLAKLIERFEQSINEFTKEYRSRVMKDETEKLKQINDLIQEHDITKRVYDLTHPETPKPEPKHNWCASVVMSFLSLGIGAALGYMYGTTSSSDIANFVDTLVNTVSRTGVDLIHAMNESLFTQFVDFDFTY